MEILGWENLIPDNLRARAAPEPDKEIVVLAEDNLAEMTRLAMKTTREILTLDANLFEKEFVSILKLKQAAAADVYRTATRVDETIMRRQEASILPKLWARLQEEKLKRLG